MANQIYAGTTVNPLPITDFLEEKISFIIFRDDKFNSKL